MAANYAITSIGYDTTFELNEFNEPRIRSEIETLKDVLKPDLFDNVLLKIYFQKLEMNHVLLILFQNHKVFHYHIY